MLITLAAKGIALPLGILSGVIAARMLGPSGRGALAILLVIQGIAVQFGTLGLNASITYFIARNKDSTNAIASNALVVALVVGTILALVFYVIGQTAPSLLLGSIDPIYLTIFVVSIPFTLLAQFLQNVFLAKHHIVEFNALDLFSRLLQLVGFAVVLVVFHGGTLEAVWCLTGVTMISGIVYSFRAVRVSAIGFKFDRTLFVRMFRYGARTYAASFFMVLLLRSSILLINHSLGDSQSGIYSVTMQIMDIVYLFPVTLGMILFPKVSERADDSGELTAKAFRLSLVVMACVCVFLLVFGGAIIEGLFGPEFIAAATPLYWLTPGILFLSLATILNNDLAGRGLPHIVILSPMVGLFLNVALQLLFLSQHGITVSAISSSLSFLVVLVLLTTHFCQRTKIPPIALISFRLEELKSIRIM